MARTLTLTLSVALILWLAAASLAQAQAPAPAFKEGDTWQLKFEPKGQIGTSTNYLNGVYELKFTEGGFKSYEIEGGRGVGGEISFEAKGDRSLRLLYYFGYSKLSVLNFPLSVGQKWNYEYTIRSPGGAGDQKRSVEVNVVGMEDVTTSAGTFKTFKLVAVEAYYPTPRTKKYVRITMTYFYSPETKSIVKGSTANDSSDATQDYEVIKFTPGS